MKKSNIQILFLLLLGLFCESASASWIGISGQALPLNQGLPNQDSYNFRSDDGALTSLQYDTGLLAGNSGTARSAANVNIEQGTLGLYTEINGREVASANTRLNEELFFDLPDGVQSVEVTLNFMIQGIFSGTFSGCSTCLSARLEFGNDVAPNSAPDQQVVFLLQDLEVSGLPIVLSITRTVIEGASIRTNSGLSSASNSPAGSMADLSAFLSLEVPDGVTFTSTSGAFLTNVPPPSGIPEPASVALIVLGSIFLGWSRRNA